MNRPLTIREIQAQKKKIRDAESNKVSITNLSQWQSVPVQIYGKNSKMAFHQITIMIPPKGKVDLPEHRLIDGQITNLRKRGLISVSKSGNITSSSSYKNFISSSIMKKSNTVVDEDLKKKKIKSKSNKN